MRLVVIALLLSASAASAQSFRAAEPSAPRDRQSFERLARDGVAGAGSFGVEQRYSELKCEYTNRTTALCSCNHEPSREHERACLEVLRANCGRVVNGEALCPVDPPD